MLCILDYLIQKRRGEKEIQEKEKVNTWDILPADMTFISSSMIVYHLCNILT